MQARGRSPGRSALDPLPDRRQVALGHEIVRREELGGRDVETLDPFLLQNCRGRLLERVRPDDVAGEKTLGLAEERLTGHTCVWLLDRLLERVLQPAQSVRPVAERLDGARVRTHHRAGRVQLLCALHLVVGGLREPAELRVEVLLVEPGSREERAQLLPESRGRVADRADLGEIRLVPIPLRVCGAALDPDDQQDDDENRERDQSDEPQERREVARPTEPGARASTTSSPVGRRQRLDPLGLFPGGRVFLFEEVEIQDVFVARTHCAAPPL